MRRSGKSGPVHDSVDRSSSGLNPRAYDITLSMRRSGAWTRCFRGRRVGAGPIPETAGPVPTGTGPRAARAGGRRGLHDGRGVRLGARTLGRARGAAPALALLVCFAGRGDPLVLWCGGRVVFVLV